MNTNKVRDDVECGRSTRPKWVAKNVAEASALSMNGVSDGRMMMIVTMQNAIRAGQLYFRKQEQVPKRMAFAALRWSVNK